MKDSATILLEDLPNGRQTLLQTCSELENVANYCTTNYTETRDKQQALSLTMSYTTQSLGSVAYQINMLATSFLEALDQQNSRLLAMEGKVNELNMHMNVHQEKVARRSIGGYTTSKEVEMFRGARNMDLSVAGKQPIGHMRRSIDYGMLDGLGHGIRLQDNQMPTRFGTLTSRRSSSTASSSDQPGGAGSILYDRQNTWNSDMVTQGVGGGNSGPGSIIGGSLGPKSGAEYMPPKYAGGTLGRGSAMSTIYRTTTVVTPQNMGGNASVGASVPATPNPAGGNYMAPQVVMGQANQQQQQPQRRISSSSAGSGGAGQQYASTGAGVPQHYAASAAARGSGTGGVLPPPPNTSGMMIGPGGQQIYMTSGGAGVVAPAGAVQVAGPHYATSMSNPAAMPGVNAGRSEQYPLTSSVSMGPPTSSVIEQLRYSTELPPPPPSSDLMMAPAANNNLIGQQQQQAGQIASHSQLPPPPPDLDTPPPPMPMPMPPLDQVGPNYASLGMNSLGGPAGPGGMLDISYLQPKVTDQLRPKSARDPPWAPEYYIQKVCTLYEYQADKNDELTFGENRLIFVTKKNDDGWWEGVMEGVTGLFPGNYVEPIE